MSPAPLLSRIESREARLAIIGLGSLDVFSGAMTIGALVAFNMLAGRVSSRTTCGC